MLLVFIFSQDSAPTAMASSNHFGNGKRRAIEAMPAHVLQELTAEECDVANQPLKKRRCQNHVHSFLCTHFIGQSVGKKKQAREKSDNEKASHGQVEYKILTRFMAADVLSDHFALVGGSICSKDSNKRWIRENNIDFRKALKWWAWIKMGVKFNKCDRNPVPNVPSKYSCMRWHDLKTKRMLFPAFKSRPQNRGMWRT